MNKMEALVLGLDFWDACKRTRDYKPLVPIQPDMKPKDKLMQFQYWLKVYGKVLKMGLDVGLLKLLKNMQKMPWIYDMAKANIFMQRGVYDRSGNYLKGSLEVTLSVTTLMTTMLTKLMKQPEMVIISEDMVPPEIYYAMGIVPWMAELFGIIGTKIDGHASERYIDAAENAGIPPNTCTLPKITIGQFLMDHMPEGSCLVSANLPCDAGATSYGIIAEKTGLPAYRLDVPHYFNDERAVELFVKDLKGMIAFLEEHTPGRMDWDKLKQICEQRNRQVELEMELWELNRTRPAPLPTDCVTLNHLYHINTAPGFEQSTRNWETVLKLARENHAKGIGGSKNERYRCIMWNPGPDMFGFFPSWIEYRWGIVIVHDSMSYNTQPLIDTSSHDSMLAGLGHDIMTGPMARHTRGPMENYFRDMFHVYEYMDADMIIMNAHIGCKNTMALNQVMREECRKRNIPVCIYEYDLMDPRVVSIDGIKSQVDHFMKNIMKAEPLH